MNKTISRNKIIKAIKTEPLMSGDIVEMTFGYHVSTKRNSEVCALGAVLRKAGYSNRDIHTYGNRLSRRLEILPILTEKNLRIVLKKNTT